MTLTANPKANAQAWADALRSGNYTQDRENSALWAPTDGHCCLGVAADLIVQSGEGKWVEEGSKMELHTGNSYNRAALDAPSLDKFGIHDDDTQWRYVHLNDARNFTFAEIAEVIERTLVGTEPMHKVVDEITQRKEAAVINAN